MDPNTVVLEISSDEEIGWNDHDGSGFDDGDDDHDWLSELLDEVNKEEKNGDDDDIDDDSDEVVLVSESEVSVSVCVSGSVSPSEKTVKKSESKSKSKSKLESCLIELDDDCVVLEDDPDKPVEVRNDNGSNVINDDDDDILVVSEKGQVACRDYPHPRHLCIKFPFSTTPNQSHCEQCYCYVCDSLAPCIYWGNGSASMDHCRATDKDEIWKLERKNAKKGIKGVQPVPKMDFHGPVPILAQPHIQIPRPQIASGNFQIPNIINQNQPSLFASRNKFPPDLVSQLLIRRHGSRALQNHNNLVAQLQRQVFKRNGSVGVVNVTTANRPPLYNSYRGNFVNPNGNQTFDVNRMVSGSSKYLGSLQPNAVNSSVSYPQSQSQNHISTINPLLNQQPLPPEPPFANHLNPNFQSQLNSIPFPENPIYQQPHLVPSSSRPQLASVQPRYMGPALPNYPVPPQTQVHNPSIPVSDYTLNFQGNQAQSQSQSQNQNQSQSQGPTIDSSFQDYGLSWSPTEHSATFEGGEVATNEPSLAADSGGSIADYPYDWIFDNQPVEPGFIDIPGPFGSNELTDSAFIDTGPIFDF